MTLKLPTIEKGQAPRLVAPDVSQPLREARARAQALHTIGGVVTDIAGRYAKRELKREQQEALLSVHEANTGFMAQFGGQDEFRIGDIDDPIFLELAEELGYEDPEAVIPNHRIFAEWRKRSSEEAAQVAATNMSSKSAQQEFLNDSKIRTERAYAEDSVKASKDQIKYTARQTMNRVETYILRKDFEGARLAVDTSDMGTEATQRAHDAINTREQMDYFYETIENRDIDIMEKALKELHTNDPKTTSNITAENQKILANQLRTAINTEKTAVQSAMNSSLQIQKDDAQTQIKDIWNNKPVDMMEYEANKRAISRKYPVLAREMEWAQKHQPTIAGVLMAPPSIQVEALNGLKARSTGDRETSYLINQLETAIARGQTERRNDSLKWADSTGFVAISPIDYTSVATAQASLAERVKPVLSIQRRFGTFTGFLTKDELVEFGGRLENAPNKLEYFAAINGALGEYAEPFYEQLKQYNVGETAALAGQIMTWGDAYRPVAENILKGSNLRKTDKLTQLKMKEVNSELDAFAISRFGGIFTGNKKQQSLNIEAFKDVYAITGDKEEAFEQLTGGTIDYNGYTIQTPIPGMSGWSYKSYMKNIRPEYWATPEMRVHGYTPVQLRESFLNGNLKQAGLGRGVSFLVEPDGTRVKNPDGVTDFKFVFNPDAPTSAALLEEWKAEQEAEREEEARRIKQEEAARKATDIEWLLRGLGD